MSESITKLREFQSTKMGLIPRDWNHALLEDLSIKIMVGIASAATHAYRDDGVILFRNQNIKEGFLDDEDILYIDPEYEKSHRNKRLKGGDLLTARTGYPGTTCKVPNKYEGAQSFTTLITRPNSKLINSDFLCYYINSSRGQSFFESTQIGGGQKNVNASSLSKMPIPIPSSKEQQKIAEILSTWDEAITLTKSTIEELKHRNKGLAQQLLTGKKRLKGFEGEWNHLKIADIAKHQTILNKNNEVIEVLSCTKYDGLVRSLDYFGRKVFGDDLSKYKIVPKGSFAYATNHIEEGSIGYQNLMNKGLVSPMYTVFKTNPEINDDFFYRLLKTDRMIYAYQSNTSGSIARRGGLRWNDFSTLHISIPSLKEQAAINSVLSEADKELKLYQQQIDTLKEQKKGLMQKLLTGEIRILKN